MNTELYDEITEKIVLGQCMAYNFQLPSITQVLAPDDFGIVGNQIVYSAILETSKRNDGISAEPNSVLTTLNRNGDGKRIGGIDYLLECYNLAMEPDSAIYNAKETKRLSLRRKGIQLMRNGILNLEDLSKDLSNGFSDITNGVDALARQESEGFTGMSLKKLHAIDFEPIKWMVPDLVPEGLTVLGGPFQNR